MADGHTAIRAYMFGFSIWMVFTLHLKNNLMEKSISDFDRSSQFSGLLNAAPHSRQTTCTLHLTYCIKSRDGRFADLIGKNRKIGHPSQEISKRLMD